MGLVFVDLARRSNIVPVVDVGRTDLVRCATSVITDAELGCSPQSKCSLPNRSGAEVHVRKWVDDFITI